jgi:hypothetical protein
MMGKKATIFSCAPLSENSTRIFSKTLNVLLSLCIRQTDTQTDIRKAPLYKRLRGNARLSV